MNAHLGNAFADGFAIAEIPECRAEKSRQYSGLAFWSAKRDSHASKWDERSNVFKSLHCIRVDTFPQEALTLAFGRRPFHAAV